MQERWLEKTENYAKTKNPVLDLQGRKYKTKYQG